MNYERSPVMQIVVYYTSKAGFAASAMPHATIFLQATELFDMKMWYSL